jgi:hypothetical protein
LTVKESKVQGDEGGQREGVKGGGEEGHIAVQ